jgi:hypothetical protein
MTMAATVIDLQPFASVNDAGQCDIHAMQARITLLRVLGI